jgi:dTDP-4-amino-4,6-dideoxygalactose transaminase
MRVWRSPNPRWYDGAGPVKFALSMRRPLIALTTPARAPRELEYLEQVLRNGHLQGDGAFTARASTLLSGVLDDAHVLLTTSCTHALELMALLFDVGAGDEVVLPSFTFPSTANAFALRGCRLRFVDVDPTTWSAELPQIEAGFSSSTKAVVSMGYGGVQRDLPSIANLCAERGVWLGEDAAHGLFARQGDRALGTVGALGALSFHATKNITCGEGGALVVNDPSLRERAEIAREKGTDRARYLRGEVAAYSWQTLGSSYLPSELLAAVLCAQLENAEASQSARHAVVDVYADVVGGAASRLGLTLQATPAGAVVPAHVFGVLLPPDVDRTVVVTAMRERGVVVASHYEPLHLAPAAKTCATPTRLPVTEDIARRLVRLPLHPGVSVDDAAAIAAGFVDVVGRAGRG